MSASGVRLTFAARPDFGRGGPGIAAGRVGARCEEQSAVSLLPLLTLLWLAPATPPAPTAPPAATKVDLNAATEAQLRTLPGVGPKRAQAIITRRQRRPFRRVRDLRFVKGIGPKRYRQLKDLVRVHRPARVPASKRRSRRAPRTRAPRCWPRPAKARPPADPAVCVRPHHGGLRLGP